MRRWHQNRTKAWPRPRLMLATLCTAALVACLALITGDSSAERGPAFGQRGGPAVNMVAAPPAEVCGDGIVTEACDDGGTAAGDGCSATCTIEANATCLAGSVPSVCYPWDPTQIAGTQLYISTGQPLHLWQQTDLSGEPALARTAVATDLVGRIDSPINGHVLTSPAAGSRPTYRAGPFAEFDGTADRWAVHNSVSAFDFIHNTLVFTIACKVGVYTDGAAETILDNNNATGANAGIDVARNAAGTVNVFITRVGTTLFNCNTTDTILNASERVPLEIRGNNASGIDIRINGGTLSNCARSAAPSGSASAGGNLSFGGRTNNTNFGNIEIADCLITDTYVSDGDLTLWRNRTVGAGDPASYVRQTGLANAAGAPWFNRFLHRWHDFSDATTLFEDVARTNPVASDNDPIRVVTHKADGATQPLNREVTAPADGERPLWDLAGTGALFDSVDDDMLFDSMDSMAAGARTWCVISRHDNVGNSADFSHIMNAGSGYWSLSGATYAGNPGGAAYNIIHLAVTPDNLLLGNENGFNINCWRRDGTELDGTSRGGGLQNIAEGTTSEAWQLTGFSDDVAEDMDGEIVEFLSWQVRLSDAQLQVVINGLVLKHGGLAL